MANTETILGTDSTITETNLFAMSDILAARASEVRAAFDVIGFERAVYVSRLIRLLGKNVTIRQWCNQARESGLTADETAFGWDSLSY